jgi:serine/threonine-protein kinase
MAKEPDDRYGSAGAFGRAAQRSLRADWRVAPDANTMAAPQPAPQVAPPPPVSYGWATPPAPQPVNAGIGQRDLRGSSRRWVLPAVIAAVVALLLGSVGVIIGLLAQPDSPQSPAPGATTGYPGSTEYETPNSEVTTTSSTIPSPIALPAAALGPDGSQAREVCNEDYVRPSATGWGIHARRGSAKTSCAFTRNVLNEYWTQYGRPALTQRTISVPGTVSCPSTGSTDCDGNNFRMRCAPDGSGTWIRCTGGDNAVVYIY